MTWVRLADDFYRHPKVLRAGPLAGWLWVAGLGYANHYLTDGYLPSAAVRGLTDLDDPFRLAAKLVDAGLWESAEGGYQIHDYDAYQPAAEAVKAERAANAARVADWRERQRNSRSNGVRNSVGNASPVPGPGPVNLTPVPAGTTSPLPPPPAEGEAPPTEAADLSPLSDDDQLLWARARDEATDGMLAANAKNLSALEPLGRGPDGALWLRAPPEAAGVQRFLGAVRGALVRAGDQSGGRAVIVTS